MRTTIELPDEVMARAKTEAAGSGITLKEFFLQAIVLKLTPPRVRRDPPTVDGPRLGLLRPEEIENVLAGGAD
ncbi:MAG: hypothetical protein JNL98_06825 [Bryobacterales bacterium]|nr:hypothetical protein [Bryobacterales bacterium]